MLPRSSVTVFSLGYRSGSPGSFLDQVDMGVNMGGLSRVDQQVLTAELAQQQDRLACLRLDHEAAKLALEGTMAQEEELRNSLEKLGGDLTDHIGLMEDAYARRDVGTAMGLELAHKNLRIELAVRFRDLSQKAMGLLDVIKKVHQELSIMEFNMISVEHRLWIIGSKLSPVANLGDALNP